MSEHRSEKKAFTGHLLDIFMRLLIVCLSLFVLFLPLFLVNWYYSWGLFVNCRYKLEQWRLMEKQNVATIRYHMLLTVKRNVAFRDTFDNFAPHKFSWTSTVALACRLPAVTHVPNQAADFFDTSRTQATDGEQQFVVIVSLFGKVTQKMA